MKSKLLWQIFTINRFVMHLLFKTTLRLAAITACCFVAGCSTDNRLPHIEPEPNPPTINGIPLSIRSSDYNNIVVSYDGDEAIIRTTGLDPYIWLDASVPVDFSKRYMLAFDSFNTSEPLSLVIFVGEVCDSGHLLENGDYTLPRTEGWSSVSYNLSKVKESPSVPFRSVRVRFGLNGNHTFRLKNPVLREPNKQELDAITNENNRLKEEQALTNRLKSYLSKNFTSKIETVIADYTASTIVVTGTANVSDFNGVGLAEIPMWLDQTKLASVESFTPLTSGAVAQTFPRFADDGRDRLLSGWAVVKHEVNGYTLLSAVHHTDRIDNPRAVLEKKVPSSIKGIGGCPFDHSDMVDLNIGGANFNIILDQILYTEPGGGRVPYTYAGKTYYADVNGSMIKQIDHDVKIAQQMGLLTSAILLVPINRGAAADSWLGLVAHPENEYSAAFSMPNMLSKEAVEAYAATMNFLCERYSTEEYGRIHNWIIHNEIQSGFYWTNAGKRNLETYMNLYERSMRLVQTIARQYDSNAKSLISLDHGWTYAGSDRAYQGVRMLEQLLKYCRQEGDFEWGIAFHPYPQDINNPRTWLDDQATYSFSTPYITPKNIEVLDAWVELPEVCFNGTTPREIQFTEQGINSPDYASLSLSNQAAGVAYSLAKIRHMKNLTTYDYHLWADAHEEGSLRLGLRKYRDNETDPLGKKPSWDVFRAFEQSDWETVSAPYLNIIGISNWDEAYYTGTISK